VYRPLFFRRYGAILPRLTPAIWLNAALFSLAHLMYWSWIVTAMTFSGGLAFAWAYEARRNFPMAVVLHAVAGVVVFLLGLGVFFYSGNVRRPF
jgi:membrane protease YdiL (CAAX protease family)